MSGMGKVFEETCAGKEPATERLYLKPVDQWTQPWEHNTAYTSRQAFAHLPCLHLMACERKMFNTAAIRV